MPLTLPALSNVVNSTYNLTTASGTQDITGFGFNPTEVQIAYGVSGSSGLGIGHAAGSTQATKSASTDSATSMNSSTTGAIFYSNAAQNAYQFGVVSFITDGIRITWTKVGAPTGTLLLQVLGRR